MQNRTASSSYYHSYLTGMIYGNAALIIGHPAERLKVATQINLGTSYYNATKPIIHSIKNLYAGFFSCIYRQNTKLLYRSFLMTEMPHQVDQLNLGFLAGTVLKAFFASSFDTLVTTPFENIKTLQMRTNCQTSIYNTGKEVYHTRGWQGFFFGTQPTLAKSFPAWTYLFMGYHATKDKRQQQGFLATIYWATLAAIPITIASTPIDVIKTQMQAGNHSKSLSIFNTAKQIINNYGLFALTRGLPFRIMHKSLATATAYAIMDASAYYKNNHRK